MLAMIQTSTTKNLLLIAESAEKQILRRFAPQDDATYVRCMKSGLNEEETVRAEI